MSLFEKDKISLTLEKYDFKPGDKIKGTVKLNLKNRQRQENWKYPL